MICALIRFFISLFTLTQYYYELALVNGTELWHHRIIRLETLLKMICYKMSKPLYAILMILKVQSTGPWG